MEPLLSAGQRAYVRNYPLLKANTIMKKDTITKGLLEINLCYHKQAIELLENIQVNRKRIDLVEEQLSSKTMLPWELWGYYHHKVAIYNKVDNRLLERYTNLVSKIHSNSL